MLLEILPILDKLAVEYSGEEGSILAPGAFKDKLADDFDGDIINHTITLGKVTNLTITRGIPDEWRERKQPLVTTEDLLATVAGILRYPTLEYDKEHNDEKEITTVL